MYVSNEEHRGQLLLTLVHFPEDLEGFLGRLHSILHLHCHQLDVCNLVHGRTHEVTKMT